MRLWAKGAKGGWGAYEEMWALDRDPESWHQWHLVPGQRVPYPLGLLGSWGTTWGILKGYSYVE